MAKGSKYWFEKYEKGICKYEEDSDAVKSLLWIKKLEKLLLTVLNFITVIANSVAEQYTTLWYGTVFS